MRSQCAYGYGTHNSVSPFWGRFVNLEQIMQVHGRTNRESSINWINIFCVSLGLVVGVIMVTPLLTGEEVTETESKEPIRFTLSDDTVDGTVTTKKRAPIVHRNVNKIRENGLRYEQGQDNLRQNQQSTVTARALDPSKDPIISAVPKAPIVGPNETQMKRKEISQQPEEAVAENKPAITESKKPEKPSTSTFAFPEIDLPAIEFPSLELPEMELPEIELPAIELPDLAKVFESGTATEADQSLPPEDKSPKVDADEIVRQHLNQQQENTNGPPQPDMSVALEENLPKINYPNQSLPGIRQNTALLPPMNGLTPEATVNAAPAEDTTNFAGQLAGDVDMGSSVIPTPMRTAPKINENETEPTIKPAEQIVTKPLAPLEKPEAKAELASLSEPVEAKAVEEQVVVKKEAAPIVSGDVSRSQTEDKTPLPPMPVVQKKAEAPIETLKPGTPPNRLRKQPEFPRPFTRQTEQQAQVLNVAPSKSAAMAGSDSSAIETAVDGWDSAVKQVSGIWQMDGTKKLFKSTNIAGIAAKYESVWMRRNAKKSPSLSQDMTLDGFDYESSNRLTLGYYDNDVTGVELVYMGELDWATSGTISSATEEFSDSFLMHGDIEETDLNTFGLSNEHHQRYDVSMHSVELMKVWRGWDVMKTSVGFRYVNVNENFLFRSTNSNGSGVFTSDLDNHIAGLQFGLEMRHTRGPRLSFGFKGKAGIYGNFNDSITRLTNGGTLMFDNDDKELQVSFVGELGLDAQYRINDRITLRAGYELLYITGVATVGGQPHLRLNSMTGSVIDDDTDILVHGGSVGLRFTW